MLPSTDQAQPSTNQYRQILTLYLQVPTITALFWPSAIKYKPVFERILTGRSLLITLRQINARTSVVEFDQGYLSFFLAKAILPECLWNLANTSPQSIYSAIFDYSGFDDACNEMLKIFYST